MVLKYIALGAAALLLFAVSAWILNEIIIDVYSSIAKPKYDNRNRSRRI